MLKPVAKKPDDLMSNILFLVPSPPPFAGPEVANGMLLKSEAFMSSNVIHVRANLRKKNEEKGGFDLKGITAFVRLFGRILYTLLFKRISHFYFLLSSSRVGFFRDIIYILLARLVFRKKTIAHYRGSNFAGFYNNQSTIYQKIIKRSLKLIDVIIVQGHAIQPTFTGLFPEKDIRVVYNGIKAKPLHAEKVNKESVNLLFVGHLWFPKGFYDLIKAYKSLFQKYGKKIRLQLAGEFIGYNENALEFLNGEWRDYYLREKENLKLEMNSFIAEKEQYNIVFEGVLMGDKKDEAFRSADIFVLPSYTEGFSMACLEAMAWGLPIVTTPVGALQEVIKPGINGLLTPVGDAGKLAEKLEKLIENEGLRKEMATNNRKEVNECYDIEVIARHLIETIAAV